MSYINQDTLKLQKRRPSVKKLTPEQAVEEANRVVDLANDHVAKWKARAEHWMNVTNTYAEENERLRQQLTALEIERDTLLAENARLARKVTKRQGKRKGEEWGE